jgi:curved DNA-binding protein CbpA
MRPFETFGTRPFLWASPEDLSQIQRKYLALSREFHPDRVNQADPEVLEKAETQTALINLDYSRMRDFWKLVDSVLAEGLDPSACPVRANKLAPPELTAEYFDLQERAMEENIDSSAVKKAFAELELKISSLVRAQEHEILDFAKRYPFQGFGQFPKLPWTQDELLELKGLLEQVRYSRSFLKDLKAKFGAANGMIRK